VSKVMPRGEARLPRILVAFQPAASLLGYLGAPAAEQLVGKYNATLDVAVGIVLVIAVPV
jgi:hypothetical protein